LGCADDDQNFCSKCGEGLFYHEGLCLIQCPSQYSAFPYSSVVALEEADYVGYCLPCDAGCLSCLDGNSSHCMECEEEYFSLNYTSCLTECPEGYQANTTSMVCDDVKARCPYGYTIVTFSNGSYGCQLTQVVCDEGYVVNTFLDMCIPEVGLFLPFPNLILALVTSSVVLLIIKCRGYLYTHKVTVLIQIWSLVEILIYWQQAALAFLYNFWAIAALSGVGICLHYSLNIFVGWYFKRKEKKDKAFLHWSSTFPRSHRCYSCFQLLYSFKAFLRCYVSCLFHMKIFQASFSFPQPNFFKPLIKVTILNVLLTHLPVMVAAILALITVPWPYQLFITSIEAMVTIVVIDVLSLVEMRQNSRDNQAPYFKIEPADFKQMQVMGGLPEENSGENSRD